MACRIVTDRIVLGLFLVDEEHAAEQDPLRNESWIGCPVDTDYGRFRGGGQLLVLDLLYHHPLAGFGNRIV